MTREESLSIITEAIEDYVCNYVTDTAKAQKMLNAIQTLEQEPCEGCEVGNPCLYCRHEFEPQERSEKE